MQGETSLFGNTLAIHAIDQVLKTSNHTLLLDILPDEIILAILDKIRALDGMRDRKALLALTRVSRHINFLTTALVYEEFDTVKGDPNLFLRSMVTVPGFADHLKYITWGYNAYENGTRWIYHFDWITDPPYTAHCFHQEQTGEVTIIAAKLQTLTQPFALEVAEHLRACSPQKLDEVALSAIMLLAPQISVTDAGWVCTNDDPMMKLCWLNLLRFAVPK